MTSSTFSVAIEVFLVNFKSTWKYANRLIAVRTGDANLFIWGCPKSIKEAFQATKDTLSLPMTAHNLKFFFAREASNTLFSDLGFILVLALLIAKYVLGSDYSPILNSDTFVTIGALCFYLFVTVFVSSDKLGFSSIWPIWKWLFATAFTEGLNFLHWKFLKIKPLAGLAASVELATNKPLRGSVNDNRYAIK